MKKMIVLACCLGIVWSASAQVFTNTEAKIRTNKKGSQYQFTTVADLATTDVKNQGKSGTCWSYSSNSFVESELLRMGKDKEDLSEMFVVRKVYSAKADNYIRMFGKAQFAEGGEFHDNFWVLKNFGAMPQGAYPGKQSTFDHTELDAVLKSFMETIVKMGEKGKISSEWRAAYEGIIDAYAGKLPERFEYKGKQYTPKEYAATLGINPDDYIEITSFTHHPFYQPFVLEVPDNWMWATAHNVPLDELQAIADNALKTGYSVAWASDVSEKTFSYGNGIALVPEKDWADMSDEEHKTAFDKPNPEKQITAEMRQIGFDNLTTQDDHGMHIVGIVKDQNGTEYYTVKNSWGTSRNDCNGYFYVSKPFFRYKTTSIVVYKDAIPKELAKKMKLTL